jgi:serine/threonine-protein kinase
MLEGRVLAGRYVLERLVGEGGMGAVFSATQLAVQRRVAVKVLLPGVADDPSVVERLQREATLVAKVARRGVPQIIDFDRDDLAGPFVVMELLVGESLADRLQRYARLHPREAASIACAVLDTLEVVHAKGVVHRDLKPPNVFLARERGGDPSVKILDFGVARVISPHGDMTVEGAVIGTPRYMAPEQAAGERADVRADVYGVGAMIYACVGGKPYASATGLDVVAAVRAGPPVPLAELNPELPASFVAVVDRAMARSPDARFASAGEMRAALTRVMADLPEAPPESAAPPSETEEMLATPQSDTAGPTAPSEARGNTKTGSTTPARGEGLRTPAPPARRRWYAHPLALVASGVVLAVGAMGIARVAFRAQAATTAPGATSAPPISMAASAAALALSPAIHDEMERARAAWRAGDPNALSLLHAVYDDVDHAGGKPLSPTGHVAAEALFLIADIEERGLRPPPAREPTRPVELTSATSLDLELQASKVLKDYVNVGAWGFMDLSVCGVYRAGRTMETVLRFNRAEEARQLGLVNKPSVQALTGMSRLDLERSWSGAIRQDQYNAKAEYEGTIMMARSFPGPFVDPTDGTDCVASALHRRDVLAAEGDGGP